MKNLKGKIFNRLKVLEFAGRNKHGQALWKVQCSCDGKIVIVAGYNLQSKNSKSCGCLQLKHGYSKSREYVIWSNAIQRCTNPNNYDYKDYGGRGVQFYEPWRKSFEAFLDYVLATIGPCPPGMSIDRINNDGNYGPGNIKWSTQVEQQNNKRNCRLITFNSKTQTVAEWAKEFGLNDSMLWLRLYRRHWSIEKALTTPKAKRTKRVSLMHAPATQPLSGSN